MLIRQVDRQGVPGLSGATVAGVVSSLQIMVFGMVYKQLALMLNAMENHRTDSEWENALVVKVFTFNFFNSYELLGASSIVLH